MKGWECPRCGRCFAPTVTECHAHADVPKVAREKTPADDLATAIREHAERAKRTDVWGGPTVAGACVHGCWICEMCKWPSRHGA